MTRTEEEVKKYLSEVYLSQGFFGCGNVSGIFASAPGRVELAGNHTDHQGGRTISAAIDRRIYALAVPNNSGCINYYLEGFGAGSLELTDLEPQSQESGTSLSLIRGMAAAYTRLGKPLLGFDLVTCSDIPVGGGLSSSAAFEVLTGAVIRAIALSANHHTALTDPDALMQLALDAVWAEQTYFGKPCGAQDQLVSAFGGILALDFANVVPRVSPIVVNTQELPYTICLVDSHCDHSAYTDEFATITGDMHSVAEYLGFKRLGDTSCQTVLEHIGSLRQQLGDRRVLRALHFFAENERVALQQQALQDGDFHSFLQLVRLSGVSSAQFLQNITPINDPACASQPLMLVLALCAQLLEGNSFGDRRAPLADDSAQYKDGLRPAAYRVHGGGFGGSVLAFVPKQVAGDFIATMNMLLGYDACLPVKIGARGVWTEVLD